MGIPKTTRGRAWRLSPATHSLLGAGTTVTALAATLGVSQSTASNYLAGRTRLPETMSAALATLMTEDAALRVLALIPPAPNTEANRGV